MNRCRSKPKDTPATSSPSPKELGQDVKPWSGKKDKPRTQNNAAVNNVESSSTECDAQIFFYDRADIAAEPWLMDSGATDHMTPWGSDFTSYTPYQDSKNSVILGDSSTRLEILGKGTVRRWCKSSGSHVMMEMDNVLHVKGIKRRFLSTDRLVRKGFQVNFTNVGAEIKHPTNRFSTTGTRNGPYYWHHLYPQNPDATTLNTVESLPIKTWHERMGHLNWDAIKQTRRDNPPLLGIKLDSSEPRGTCEGCIAGKDK